MQIVIDIPKEKYQGIISMAEEILDASTFCSPRYLYKAVLNGTPLPKGHGRIIDETKISKCEQVGLIIKDGNITRCFTTDALTIIEADKAESEE